jgi:hypothetical protein
VTSWCDTCQDENLEELREKTLKQFQAAGAPARKKRKLDLDNSEASSFAEDFEV